MSILSSRFSPDGQEDPFHSNAIAGGGIGSTSAESFEQRKNIERNRQLVHGYRNAGTVHGYRAEARKDGLSSAAVRQGDEVGEPRTRSSSSVNRTTRRVTSPALPRSSTANTFREPGGRGYSPYS